MEEIFSEFTYEIRNLALKYPADVVEKKIKGITPYYCLISSIININRTS